MTELKNLTKEEYEQLKASGMMWEFHPEATGVYEDDVEKPRKESLDKMMKRSEEVHRVWHKFSKWLTNTYGKDLYGEWQKMTFKTAEGKKKTLRYRGFNDYELSKRLCGYEVMERVEKYVKRSCPEIKIVHCDDEVYSGSIILLIPHPSHGITVMFIPQLTNIQNRFFLYSGHYKMLLKTLQELESVYDKEDLEDYD